MPPRLVPRAVPPAVYKASAVVRAASRTAAPAPCSANVRSPFTTCALAGGRFVRRGGDGSPREATRANWSVTPKLPSVWPGRLCVRTGVKDWIVCGAGGSAETRPYVGEYRSVPSLLSDMAESRPTGNGELAGFIGSTAGTCGIWKGEPPALWVFFGRVFGVPRILTSRGRFNSLRRRFLFGWSPGTVRPRVRFILPMQNMNLARFNHGNSPGR